MVPTDKLVEMTSAIVAAYLSNNSVKAEEVPGLIVKVHAQVSALNGGEAPRDAAADEPVPAVPPRQSVTKDYIICLEDGLKFKSMKRHLRSAYDMSPDEYRAKWRLPYNYPMVAPTYSKRRSDMAKEIGLGQDGNPRRAGLASAS